MRHARPVRRTILLAASLLSGCAASDPSPRMAEASQGSAHSGAAGAFLAGRFAATRSDLGYASDEFLKALALDPGKPELEQQAFLSTLLMGRPEATRLARQQPDNPAAQLLLGNVAAANGNWEAAENRFAGLPHQGLTQVLQPLLVAWTQQGGGHTDAALSTLKPFVEGQRFRAVYVLHAALIADVANRPGEAARLYRSAESEFGTPNLELTRMLASFEARQGHPTEARAQINTLLAASSDLGIAGPGLKADVARKPVRRATDGMAEAYLALAAALHSQDANDFAIVLVRLALDLRPDFTPARMLFADVTDNGKNPAAALQVLAPISADDPLIAVIRLRRAALTERAGNTDDALRQLDAMARDYPDRSDPLALKGDILRGKKRFADAVAAYDQAIARLPEAERTSWPLFYERGIALDRAHQWAKAEADFQHALQMAPDQPAVLNYLGYSWAEQGRNLVQAHDMIQKAVEARPNDGSIIDSLGWIELKQGHTASAVQSLERAAELDSQDSTINGHLGDAYWAAGRKLEAEYQWRRALALNPDPDDVPKIEAKLRDAGVTVPKAPATVAKSLQ